MGGQERGGHGPPGGRPVSGREGKARPLVWVDRSCRSPPQSLWLGPSGLGARWNKLVSSRLISRVSYCCAMFGPRPPPGGDLRLNPRCTSLGSRTRAAMTWTVCRTTD